MTRHIQWIGVKLPLSHPYLGLMFGKFTKTERDALMAVETAAIGMVVIPGKTQFVIGPEQGFSKSYLFAYGNNYTEVMAPGDAARLFKGAIREWETFRDLDYPPHRNKVATYPSLSLMSGLGLRDTRSGKVYKVTPEQARIVDRMIRKADKAHLPGVLQEETGTSGLLTSGAQSILATLPRRSRR